MPQMASRCMKEVEMPEDLMDLGTRVLTAKNTPYAFQVGAHPISAPGYARPAQLAKFAPGVAVYLI